MGMPAEDYTFVRFGSMDEAYEDLKKVITELDRVTDQLYADIKKELGPSWEGDAQQYFDKKREEWNTHEKAMGEQLFQGPPRSTSPTAITRPLSAATSASGRTDPTPPPSRPSPRRDGREHCCRGKA
jgi:hypothetical protein